MDKKEFWNKIYNISHALIRLGGLGVDIRTVYMWKRRGIVPSRHHYCFLNAAKDMDICLSYNDLVNRYKK